MPLIYKTDVLQMLKRRGWTTYELRKNKFLSEATIQHLRRGEKISWESLEMICQLLNCQPNDILFFAFDLNGPQNLLAERERNKGQKAVDSSGC